MTQHGPKKNGTDHAILCAASHLAETRGWNRFSRQDVATSTNLSSGRVSAFGAGCGMSELRDAVMRKALADRNLVILAAGVIHQHPIALGAPEELRARALANLLAQ